MKNILTVAFLAFIMLDVNVAKADHDKPIKRNDTLEVIFGEKSRVIIYVDNKDDLDDLSNYDINSMIEDMRSTMAEREDKDETIVIEDTTGSRYLREPMKAEAEREEFRQLEKEFEKEFEREFEKDVTEEANKSPDEKSSSGSSSTKTYSYKWKNPEKRTTQNFIFDFGLNNYLQNGQFPQANDENFGVRNWGSWYIGFHANWKTRLVGPLSISWGPNISWYNFKMQNSDVLLQRAEGFSEFALVDPTLATTKSKLTASFIGLSAVPMLDFGYRRQSKSVDDKTYKHWKHSNNAFRIGLGGYAGYRLGSHTKLVYREGGKRYKDKVRDDFYLENLRYGIRGVIGYGGADLFVNYDLNNLFAQNRGPELNAISFGISF